MLNLTIFFLIYYLINLINKNVIESLKLIARFRALNPIFEKCALFQGRIIIRILHSPGISPCQT